MNKELSQKAHSNTEAVTDRIRKSALSLARDLGPENVTVEGISSLAQVAKTTVYRRWPNAAAVIMDAFLADLQPLIAYRIGDTLEDTLVNALDDFNTALHPHRRKLLCHLVGASQTDSELSRAFWDNWIAPRREEGLRAIEEAGLSKKDGEVILDLVFGAFYYRLLIPHEKINIEWIIALVRRACKST